MTHFNSKAMPVNDTDYSCHIEAVELTQSIMWGPYTPPVINSLGEEADRQRHTHTHTHALTYMHACTHPPMHAHTHPPTQIYAPMHTQYH